MEYKIIIKGRLPGLNEYIGECRRNPFCGGKMKKSDEYDLQVKIRNQMRLKQPIDKPIFIEYTFYEKNRKRDLDNISGYFHKVFQDALQSAKVIENDGWNNITGFSDSFFLDKDNPRIEITIKVESTEGEENG